jgi:hypothetical protein
LKFQGAQRPPAFAKRNCQTNFNHASISASITIFLVKVHLHKKPTTPLGRRRAQERTTEPIVQMRSVRLTDAISIRVAGPSGRCRYWMPVNGSVFQPASGHRQDIKGLKRARNDHDQIED